MRKLAIALTLALLPAMAAAGTRNCTAALTTAGLCRVATNKIISYDLAPAAATELASAVCSLRNYQSPTACTASLVVGGVCTAGQIGQLVTLTCAQFADDQVRQMLYQIVRDYRVQQAVVPAQAEALATADADIGN